MLMCIIVTCVEHTVQLRRDRERSCMPCRCVDRDKSKAWMTLVSYLCCGKRHTAVITKLA